MSISYLESLVTYFRSRGGCPNTTLVAQSSPRGEMLGINVLSVQARHKGNQMPYYQHLGVRSPSGGCRFAFQSGCITFLHFLASVPARDALYGGVVP